MSLRYQDFESVDEYHFALSKVVYKLRLCGEVVTEEDLLEKTFLTADPRDLLLQHIYREKGFTTYNDLLSYLLLTEQSNKMLKKSSEMKYLEAMDQDESKGAVSNITCVMDWYLISMGFKVRDSRLLFLFFRIALLCLSTNVPKNQTWDISLKHLNGK